VKENLLEKQTYYEAYTKIKKKLQFSKSMSS